MKYGTEVKYDGPEGTAPLAFFLHGDPNGKADVAAMDKDGNWEIKRAAGRDDNGGGHTFRPAA